jgi:uncharacterized membrane protein YGL010W
MRPLNDWLAEYSTSHQNPVNKRLHWLCVPLITASIIGLLWTLSPIVALILLILAMVFYARLSSRLFLLMSVGAVAIVTMVWALSVIIISPLLQASFYLGVFIVGWIGQFYGHAVEGKKPSFFKDLQFLLIGPAWCAQYMLNKFGMRL